MCLFWKVVYYRHTDTDENFVSCWFLEIFMSVGAWGWAVALMDGSVDKCDSGYVEMWVYR